MNREPKSWEKVERSNYRVIVYPQTSFPLDELSLEQLCFMIGRKIERHVDNISLTKVEHTNIIRCKYCNNTIHKDDYEVNGCPMCCETAIEAWEKEREER